MEQRVTLARRDGIATVVLDRPEKLNALDTAMWRGVGDVFEALDGEEDLRCIVLRGAGEKAFSPGADIGEFESARTGREAAEAYGALMHRAMGAVAGVRHPTIAMIHGICVGGGLEIACCCDLRICGESSRFGVPINRIGVVMAYPEIAALIDLVGRATALEILYEARVFGAAEAKEKGLVNRVVPDGEVEAAALESARRIAEGAPLVNRWHKKFARRLAEPRGLWPAEAAEGFHAFATEDFREGVRAFMEKRKPRFEGR